MTISVSLIRVFLASMLILAACQEKIREKPDPCDGVDCSGHGTCQTVDSEPSCSCDVGYTGEACADCADGHHRDGDGPCVPIVDPCAPDPCEVTDCGAGTCTCEDGEPLCTCDENHHQLDDSVECVPCNHLRFDFFLPDAWEVLLVGSWIQWDLERGIPLSDDGTGNWSVVTEIVPGGQHTFKFVADGVWYYNPDLPVVDDLFGGFHNVVDVCDFPG